MKALNSLEPKRQNAFRNKYLAATFAVAALLICSSVFAQLDSVKYQPINGYGFRYKRMGFDSVLMVPYSTSPHTPYRAGGIRYNPTDSTLQLWTGHQWNSILTGIGNGVDTAYMLNDSILTIETPDQDFFLQVAKRHVDTLYRKPGQDSIYYQIAGIERAIKDSSGGGSTDTTSLSLRINQKLNISDTTNRWINDIRRSNDSIYIFKNGNWQFKYKDSTGGGTTGDFAPLFIADTLLKPRALFVYSGESGAAGPHDTIGLSAADKAPYDRIQILNNVTKLFEPLQIGVNNNINVNFSPGYGWELELMKAMKANEVFVGDTVYLVKTARAAATIQILLDSLPTATSRIDTAIALMRKKGLYPQGYLCYSQGINNVTLNTDTATWLKSTLYYTGQERNHLGYAPIFITELLPNGALYNNTINQMPYWDGFTFVVDSAGLTFSGSHWDSLGLAKQFRRMLSLTIDTVNRRQLYTASQANVGRKGYANLSLLKVNSDIDAGGTVTANNLLRLKANLANHFIGFNAGGASSPSGNYNTGSGFESLLSLTSGADNTANGYRSLYANTTGADNTSNGFSSLVANTTGSGNTAIGSFSLYSNTTGNNSTAVGYGTLANANPTLGVAFGYNAMQVGTGGTGNTAVGAFSLRNVTGDYCAALGYNSLLSLTSGGYSVAVGVEALHSQTTSNHNVGVGYGVFYNNVTGARNIGMGTNAGYWSLGSSNIYIGPEAGNDNNGSRNTVIGDDAFHGPTSLSGMTILGYNVGQFATSSDELWIDNSSTTSPLLHGYFSGDSLTINGYARIRDVDSVGTATGGFLFKDAITGKTKMTAAPTGTTYTFTNGLTNTSGTVSLGGTLINTTDIDNGGNLLFVHGTGEHTFRTVNGNAKFEIGTSTSSSSLSSSNSSTNLFSEINSFEGLATINAGKNGAYYNTLKLDSTGLWYIAKANVTPKTFKIDTTGQMSNDAYGSGTFTVTPATTPVYSSTGVTGERIAPKIYTALLSQSGTSDPTVNVLGTNEIGTIVWTRNSTGNYTGTLTGAFTSNKTWLICQKGDGSGSFVNGLLSRGGNNTVTLDVRDNSNTVTDNFTNISIEIRVYP